MVGFASFALFVGGTAATMCAGIPTVSATEAPGGDEAELGPVDFFLNIIGMSATDNVVSSGTRSSGIQVIGAGNSKVMLPCFFFLRSFSLSYKRGRADARDGFDSRFMYAR